MSKYKPHLQIAPMYLWRAGKRRPKHHFCSGNNMTEERRVELEHDEEDITRTEREEE